MLDAWDQALLDRFHALDIGEELTYRAFYPPPKRALRELTAFTSAAELHPHNFAIERNQLNRPAVILLNVGTDDFQERPHALLR
jgi:hypothetical protein